MHEPVENRAMQPNREPVQPDRDSMQTRPMQPESMRTERSGTEPLSTADLARTSTQQETTEQVRNRAIEENKATEGSNIRHLPQREHSTEPLFKQTDAGEFRTRWDQVQGAFVDDPRHAVEDADHLVADAIKLLATQFADERSQLEKQWQQGSDVSTEDLRVALQRYRSFFERLLAA